MRKARSSRKILWRGPMVAPQWRGTNYIAHSLRSCVAYIFGVLIFTFLLFINFYPVKSLFTNSIRNNTKIYDRNNVLLYETLDPAQGRTTETPLDQIPKYLVQATLATEDKNFYSHTGIDIKGIARAALLNIKEGEIVAGGSTITQQLVRNVIGTNKKRSLPQKIKESLLAFRVSKVFSKDEVLQMYFNKIYYGNLNYGAAAASKWYFGKDVSSLDLAESAFLAGLPQAPNRYDPFKNRDSALERKDYVLTLMCKEGFITEEELDEAKRERISFEQNLTTVRAPHFVNYVIEELEDRFGEDFVETGLEVKTTLDYHMQKKILEIALQNLALLTGRNVTNASVVVLEPRTADILAMLGSVDYFDKSIQGEVNIATSSRQPGSAMKPITYAVAFEKGWTPKTVLRDFPVRFFTAEGLPYMPKNYDYEYHGDVTVREALANSYNIPAVLAINFASVEDVLKKAREMGLETLDKSADHYGLALTLGDGEVRLIDLTSAYMVFANEGYKKTPRAILEIKDADGKTIYENENSQTGEKVLSEEASLLITDILSDNKARVPEFGLNNILELSRPAAVKTGTTRNFRDNWTIGYTPDFTVGVWVGNSDNTAMHNISGVYGAGPIWHDVMEEIHRNIPIKQFQSPLPTAQTQRNNATTTISQKAQSVDAIPKLRIKKPFDLDVFKWQPKIPAETQQIKLESEKDPSIGEVIWFINNEPIGKGDSVFWQLRQGDFEIRTKAENIESEPIKITVE